MNVTIEVADRATVMLMFSLTESFVERWLAGGEAPIPQMPHLRDVARQPLFHIPTLREWLLTHFQRGGKVA